MKDIRHIATSCGGHIIALAEFEKTVQIFDIMEQKIISEFETILDFGGERLAISEDGQVCICGCWKRHGICGYETKTGKLIWQRKDLKKVQHIQILRSSKNKVFTYFEIGPGRVLDLHTGKDLEKMPGVKYCFESKFQPINVLDKSTKIQLIDRNTLEVKANIQRQSFATLDIATSPDSIVVSESGAPLTCYDTEKGSLKWRIYLSKEGHFLKICYNDRLNKFIGISWPFVNGGNKKLRYINPDNGTIENETVINCPAETEIVMEGKFLVTSDRDLINIETGEKKTWN